MIWLLGFLIVLGVAPYLVESRHKVMSTEARKTAPGEFVTLSRGITHYHWIGPLRGPVAVCVHGLTTPSFVWHGLARGLAALGYRVLIYDLYGRGYSDRPRGRQDRAFFVGQLEELLADQGVEEDFTLIGYSMGGVIATMFAAAHPDRVRHLVLIASAGLDFNPGRIGRLVTRIPVLGDWLMLLGYERNQRRAITAERNQPGASDSMATLQLAELTYRGYIPAVLASMRGVLGADLAPELRDLHRAGLPILAIWGRKDDLIPLTSMGRLAEVSRSAKQEIVEDAGHGLVITHTKSVLDALRETLRDGLN